MPQISDHQPLLIGECRFDPRSHELWRDGACTRLPRRLSQLLLRLAQSAPEVVDRQSLIDDVWQRRMVEDDVLSRAVAELRKALGDDTKTPRYIETIPKAGYRLCAPVRPELVTAEAAASTLTADTDTVSTRTIAEASMPPQKTRLGRGPIWAALSLIALLAAGWVAMQKPPRSPLSAADTARIRPLTSGPGWESRPDISPDGQWVMYSESELGESTSRIVLQGVDGLHREVLEAAPDFNVRPVFAPDGKRLAFLHYTNERCELRLRSFPGGVGRRLADCSLTVPSSPAWSEDQASIVFVAPNEPGTAAGLSIVDIGTGAVRALTQPQQLQGPDRDAEFVPGRAAITFVRGFDGDQKLLYLDLRAASAEPAEWINGGRMQGHAWSPDGGQLLVATDQPGYRTLVLFDAQGKETGVLNARGARYPAWSRNGDLVFELAQYDANIWRLSLDNPDAAPVAVIASTRYDATPALSADGTRLAFVSTRNDFEQIFVANVDGSAQQKLPMPDGQRWSRPSFSPDGKSLLVTGYDEHNRHGIYRHDLDSGRNLHLRHLGDDASAAVFAEDGRSVFFLRLGESQLRDLWRAGIDADSLPAPVTGGEGVDQFAIDGDTLLLSTVATPGFRVLSASGATAPHGVLADVEPITRSAWTLRGRYLYASVPENNDAVLKRWDIDTGSSQTLATGVSADAVGASLQVSTDGRTLWFARTDSLSVDVMYLPAAQSP